MCRDEFRLRNFKLSYPVRKDFTHSRWLSLPVFISYRVIITGYNFGWLIYNIYLYGAKLFIYFTNWTYLVLNLFFMLATSLTIDAFYDKYRDARREPSPSTNEKEETRVEMEMGPGHESAESEDTALLSATEGEKDALRFQHKLLWLLYALSANVGLLVTLGYWTVLFDDDLIDANNITKHALNSVFMLIDTFLSSIPVRFLHFIYPLLYIIIYLGFTVVYWVLGGTDEGGQPYIYKLLDYSNFKASTGALLGFFLLVVHPGVQLILFALTKLRDYLREKQNQ